MKYIKGCEVRNKQPETNGKIQIDLMFVYVEKTKLFRINFTVIYTLGREDVIKNRKLYSICKQR